LHFFAFWTIIGYVLYVINLSMKKVFVQLWKWTLKYRKNIIYGALVFFAVQVCFFDIWWIWLNNEVFADGQQTADQNATFNQKVNDWLLTISFFQKVVYVVLYPILAVMWKLVDNSLVYWEVFGFDSVLWQLWNIVRNLANFGLWFLFLYYVFRYIFTVLGKSGKTSDKWPKWIIMRSLIAWIWIQASWFVMWALIDLSTILAYGVWWLPISTLGTQTDIWNPYMLQTVVSVDSDDVDSMAFYLTDPKWEWSNYISQCETVTVQSGWTIQETLLLAPKFIYYKNDWKFYPTTWKLCHFDDQVYYFKNLYDWENKIIWQIWDEWSDEKKRKELQHTYDESIKNAQQEITSLQLDVVNDKIKGDKGELLQIWDAHASWWVAWNIFTWIEYGKDDKLGLDTDNKWTWESWHLTPLKDTLSGSYVWVFSALYSSLLNAWYNMRVSNVVNNSKTVGLLNAVLSFCHMMAIAIPLLVMMIVFVMRIGILWMAIALSPMIVLLTVFGLDEKIDKDSILSNLTIWNLLPIIFSPAIICFAVSVSTVLVRMILNLNRQKIDIADANDFMWWLVNLTLSGLWVNLWKLLCGAIWIAITWFLLWMAVESSKLWKGKVVQWLKNLATTVLWSVPIVPVPWVWKDWKLTTEFVGTAAAFGENGSGGIISNLTNRLKNQYETRDNNILNDWMDGSRVEGRRADAYKKAIVWFTPSGADWTTQNISIGSGDASYDYTFEQVSDDKKASIIEAINGISDVNKRKAFGESKPQITFKNGENNNVTYKFIATKPKLDWQGKPVVENGKQVMEDVYKYEIQWS